MPKGWTKLTCETCGGNLKSMGSPFEWALEMPGPCSMAEIARIRHQFDELARNPMPYQPIILEGEVKICELGGSIMMQCASCGQCYERNGRDA